MGARCLRKIDSTRARRPGTSFTVMSKICSIALFLFALSLSALLLRALRCVLRVLGDHRVDRLAGGPHGEAVLGRLGVHVDERGPVGHGERLPVDPIQLVRPPRREARGAEGLGQLREVGVPERHGEEAAVVEEVLPLPHHAETLVVEDDDLERQTGLDRRRERLHGLLKAAIAVQVDDEPVGPPALRAERGRQAEAHRPEAARRDERAGLVALPELRGPHLMLADVRRDDGAEVARQPPQAVDRELRKDDVAFLPVPERRLGLPRLDLLPPVRRVGGAHEGKELLQHGPRVAVEREIGLPDLADLDLVDVDVDDLRVRRESGELARDAIVEARAHRDDEIAAVHRPVRVGRAVHAEHADRQGVRLGIGTLPHECRRDGNARFPREPADFRRRARRDHAATDVEDRALRVRDREGRAAEAHGVGAKRKRRRLRAFLPLDLGLQHVARHVHENGAGPAGSRETEGLAHGAGKLLRLEDEPVVFRDGRRHAEDVGLLEAVAAEERHRDLGRDRHDRRGVEPRVGEARDEVRRARARGREADARSARGPRVALRGVRRALLVPHEEVRDRRREKRVVQRQRRAAGVAEDVRDALRNELDSHRVRGPDTRFLAGLEPGAHALTPARTGSCAAETEVAGDAKAIGLVTAPSEAEETRSAYFARTPVVARGAGARQPRFRTASCSSPTSRSSRRAVTSSVTRSPSQTSAIGPPTAASGETWPTMNPCVAPEKRPSVTRATVSPRPCPTSEAVTARISGMPGAPFGPSWRITTTSPARISRRSTAANAAISPSKTRAGPECFRRSCPASFTTQPSGASEPRRIASPPVFLSGRVMSRTTCCPGVSRASAASSRSERPVTVTACLRKPASLSRFAMRREPPARERSGAVNRPPGFRSTKSGVRAEIASKSSRTSGTPASRAIARRCRTAFVEPPVAAQDVIAFSKAARVRIFAGVRPSARRSMTSRPAARATRAFAGAVAGTSFAPIGEMPRNVSAVAMVFAVNWPPHAPAPGQAPASTSQSPASESFPAECAPTASKTSWIVTSFPPTCPGSIDPP